jgi:hypothetical protein
VMSSVLQENLIKRNASGATGQCWDDVSQLAKIHVEIVGEQVLSASRVTTVSARVAPQAAPTVHVGAYSAALLCHRFILDSWFNLFIMRPDRYSNAPNTPSTIISTPLQSCLSRTLGSRNAALTFFRKAPWIRFFSAADIAPW